MKLIIYTDGGCRENKGKEAKATAAFVAYTEDGRYVAALSKVLVGNNNIAEYHGVGMACRAIGPMLDELGGDIDAIEFRCDSMLIVNHINKVWRTKDKDMSTLASACNRLLNQLKIPVTFRWVKRTDNKEADYLCNLAFAGTLKTDLFGPMPTKELKPKGKRKASETRKRNPNGGQVFRMKGNVPNPVPMLADPEGFAVCAGCEERLASCQCPPWEETDGLAGQLRGQLQELGERPSA